MKKCQQNLDNMKKQGKRKFENGEKKERDGESYELSSLSGAYGQIGARIPHEKAPPTYFQ